MNMAPNFSLTEIAPVLSLSHCWYLCPHLSAGVLNAAPCKSNKSNNTESLPYEAERFSRHTRHN